MPFTIHLSIVVFMPLAAGLVAAFLPPRTGRWLVVAASAGVLAYAIAMLVDFDPDAGGLRYVTDDSWISELGIRYQLGVDGLNLFLIALTALLWAPCMLWAALRTEDRSQLFMFHMALGETAVLGAFCAQDLALFVVFFDLMLVPFYFLIGGWGAGDRVRATTRFVIYTLVGSLLMLAGAIALGVIAADGGNLSFSFAVLEDRIVGEGTQKWIFGLFAVAFLVKAPLFPRGAFTRKATANRPKIHFCVPSPTMRSSSTANENDRLPPSAAITPRAIAPASISSEPTSV